MRISSRPIALAIIPALALVAACSPDPATEDRERDAAAASTPGAGEGRPAAPGEARATGDTDMTPEPTPSPVAGRTYRYTSLENCKVLRQERDEMPMTEVACPGAGSYSLQVLDSDARQVLTLVPPSSELYRVPTARIGGGGFSSFGRNVEWRGPRAASFEPDSMIVRYDVVEQPHPAPEASYLLVVKLGADPCLVAAVPPGPSQNQTARSKADDPGACIVG